MFSSAASRMMIVYLCFLCAMITFNLAMNHDTKVTNILCNTKDQHMLSLFKESIIDPSNLLSSWSEEDCCNWKGVKCSNITGRVNELHLSCFDFIFPDEYGHEVFPVKCLGGKVINMSLLKLDFLTFLDLSNNVFQAIYFEPASQRSPTIFPSLVHLDFSYNENLHMDNLRWLPRFSSLEYLDLSGINLSKETLWLQHMAMLPVLTELSLSGCGLNGINASLGYVNLTSLEVIDLSYNSFPEIPKWLFNISGISELYLNGNDLTSQIPAAMLNFQHLKRLHMISNNLSGSIPEWMGQFIHLEQLGLGYNSLSGQIPAAIGNLSSLTYLDFSKNHLNGTLPTALWKISKLESLLIGDNSFSGNLSEQNFAKLSSLRNLELQSNAFIFNFGTHWVPSFQLEVIKMENCKLGPEFPPWLYTQTSLYHLDISSSGLSFNVQGKFWSFVSQMKTLLLSNNSLSGDISTTLITSEIIYLSFNKFSGRLPRLSPQVRSFNVANNSFSGPIYHMLCQNVTGEQALEVLDISQNLLSGELPRCWMHWKSLKHVNLESNNFSGEIPDSMGLPVKLGLLKLRHNFLSGKVPSSLQKCTNLWFIDLAFNAFTGNIPSWIRPVNMALLLRSNRFNGSIPSEICQLSNLHVLDLANNSLSGPIPKCIYNITTLVTNTLNKTLFQYYYYDILAAITILPLPTGLQLLVKGLDMDYWNTFEYVRIVDISSNNLSGQIPQELFRLIALQSLNLSHNHLIGKIPSNIGQMKFLESLDLRGNLLLGEIPQSMSNLSFLSRLNLSYNNFDGRIPLSTQLQSVEASSYIGNPRLCGPPLPKNCAKEKKPNDLMKVSKNDDFKSNFKIGVGVGFSSAFCGIFGTLLFIKEWRLAYYRFLDSLYVFIAVRINRFRHGDH